MAAEGVKLGEKYPSGVRLNMTTSPTFVLYSHKKRLAAEDCFIANVLGTHACADIRCRTASHRCFQRSAAERILAGSLSARE